MKGESILMIRDCDNSDLKSKVILRLISTKTNIFESGLKHAGCS
jgi:hypothetical protein